MELSEALRTLAKFPGAAGPVLSVYLHTQWYDQHQRERVRIFLTGHINQARTLVLHSEEARQSLEHDLDRLAEWGQQLVAGDSTTRMPGMALFACHAANMWLEFPAARPFEDAFTLDERPALRQLAHLDEDYASALLVLIDSRSARVYEILSGGIVDEIDFSNVFPGRHKQGGWSQMRYQRHVLEFMERHHREVAASVTAYLEAHPHTCLMLSGQQDIVANFRATLSEPMQQRIIEALHLDMHASRGRLLAAAQEVLAQHERAEEQSAVERVLDLTAQNGLGVLGLQATLEAVNAARVQQLVLQDTAQLPGWRCLQCDHLLAQAALQCPLCGGEVSTTDLREAMVSAVLRTDGTVELIEPDERLESYDGVGALVRYK
ncbi:MAG: Vms1/Ankzf1 family peptidyl-tRNA hydrolase [Candidatus Tectimicrobiota bacterium]